MIPLRLTVKNFMCYRDEVPALDLEPIHVACLCGDNGHGKTALLDAITWALWGQARSRTQDELVHQGQTDMAVELDFTARGQRYRVSRRHSRSARSRQGATILELQVASDNGYRPITGNTIRDTEARIRDTLHMDYETFVNTAFLRQGDADRFTTSRPSERKETLAEVLDLSYYRRLEERAREKSRNTQEQLVALERDIVFRQDEVAEKPRFQEELEATRADLSRIQPQVDAHRLKADGLQRTLDTLQGRRQELEQTAGRLASARRDIGQRQNEVQRLEGRVDDYQSVVKTKAEIVEGFATLQEARAERERLDQALAGKSELERKIDALEREVAVQRERLTGDVNRLRTRISDELKPRAQRLPLVEAGLAELEQSKNELTVQERSVRRMQEKAQEAATKIRDMEVANDRLKREMEDTRKKFDMLEQGETICPLCQQPLGEEGQEHLRSEYETQGREHRRQYDQNTVDIKTLTAVHQEARADLAQFEAKLTHGRQEAERKSANLNRDKAESEKATAELEVATAKLLETERVLALEEYAVDERQGRTRLEAEVSALQYDAERHESVRRQTREQERYDELNRKLQEAVKELPAATEALDSNKQMLERLQQEIGESERRVAEAKKELEGLPSVETQLKDARTQHQELDRQRQEALVKQGVLQNALERCEILEGELRQLEAKRTGLLDDKSVYDELAVAFGKNGIQALIIETAIPQLEADANELLGRLTENRMHLRLQLTEGRRDSRSGMPSEELDIKIADEVGTRSYETFSGGEAFRINFALRIALSKLLAQRSGAPLPILFIDEGFGSQDAAGQERLTQSIQSIQDDFQKIIVITHIEQIKESFPVRIEVIKSGEGSTFTIA